MKYILTKNAKLLIKAILKLNEQGIDSPSSAELDPILPFDHKEIISTAEFLEKGDFVTLSIKYYLDTNIPDIDEITLTHKGRHALELTYLEAKSFIYQSIVVPIGVSIATTCIVWFISTCFF